MNSKFKSPAEYEAQKLVKAGRIGIAMMIAGGLLALVALLLTGCDTFGTNPSAPTAAERLVYQPVTNYVPVVVNKTNYLETVVTNVTVQQVTVQVTNSVGVTTFSTNEVPVFVYKTNEVPVSVTPTTNLQAAVTLQPKDGTTAAVQAGGAILNTFFPGIGTIASHGALALLGIWAYLRGSKLGNTSTALAQEVEVIREFIQTLPNGQQYDTALVNFLQAHQQEAGVASSVLNILAQDISNPDAKVAAAQLVQTINALQATATKLPTPSLT